MRLGNADTVLSKLRSPIPSDALLAFERHSTNASYLLASATRGKHCPSAALAPEERFPLLFLFAGSKSDCMFVLAQTPLLYFPPPPFTVT